MEMEQFQPPNRCGENHPGAICPDGMKPAVISYSHENTPPVILLSPVCYQRLFFDPVSEGER